MKVFVPMPRSLLVVFALLVSVSITGFAQAPPSADAYVTSAQPAANFGNSALLPVQAETTSYVRLNLAALPANATIAKATLRLYVNAVAAPGSFDIYQVESVWSERGLNFNSAPAQGASATGGKPVSITAASQNQFILVDITPLAQGWLDGSIPNHGVALVLTSSGGSFSFDSKESVGTGHQPELDVVFGGAVGTLGVTAGTSTPSVSPTSMVAAVLGEGRHFRNPYTYDWHVVPAVVVPPGKVGVVTSKVGQPLDELKLFRDAQEIQKYYQNTGYQKPVVKALPPVIDPIAGRGTATIEVQEAPKIKIKNIIFEGVSPYLDHKNEVVDNPQKTLRKVLKTKRRWWLSFITGSGILKEDEFEDDKDRLSEYFQNEGYIDF